MAKQSTGFSTLCFQKKRWLLLLLAMLSISTAVAFIIRAAYDSSCDRQHFDAPVNDNRFQSTEKTKERAPPQIGVASPLSFMKSKLVLLVSHELSLSGNSRSTLPSSVINFCGCPIPRLVSILQVVHCF